MISQAVRDAFFAVPGHSQNVIPVTDTCPPSCNTQKRRNPLAEPFRNPGQSMRLQFVGCGDAFGSGGRFNTCFHLVGRDINALIDCGATSLVSMNKLAIDRNAIRLILLTHFHADHVGGVPFFILEANYILKREQRAHHRRAAEPQIALRGDHGGRLSRHQGPGIALSANAEGTGNRQAAMSSAPCGSPRSMSCMTTAPAPASDSASKPKAR